MRLLFVITTYFTLAITGAVSDSKRVVVKEGEDAILVVKLTPKMGNINRVELQAHSENGAKQLVYRYCSTEEEARRCAAIHHEKISLRQGHVSVTLFNVGVSDAGQYVVEVIGSNFTKKESFTLVLPETSGDQSITGCTVGIVIILIILLIVIILICCIYSIQFLKGRRDAGAPSSIPDQRQLEHCTDC